MLFLVFQLGKERYALQAKSVVEVVPLLRCKRLPHAPKGIAGVCNYRGTPIPVVDLSELTLGRRAIERLSTRLIIVNCQNAAGRTRMLGLIAEHATEILRQEPAAFATPGMKIHSAPFLGPVFMDQKGAIQLVYEQHLLAEPERERLFSGTLPLIPNADSPPVDLRP